MRPLGRTGRQVSALGLGCASWWAQARFPEREAIALVHAALERGVTVFDTGPSYGCGEIRLGKALRGRDPDRLLVLTKAGTERHGRRLRKDFSPTAIRTSVERSRKRLGLDRIPALLLHGCPPEQLDERLAEALGELVSRGWIGHAGLNSFDPVALRQVKGLAPFDLIMTDYNVLRPQRAALVSELAAAGQAVLAAAGAGRALYALDWTGIRAPRDLWYWLRALGPSRTDWRAARRLRWLSEVPGWQPVPLALRWALAHPDVACVLFNTTRLQHLHANLDAAARELPPGLAERLPG